MAKSLRSKRARKMRAVKRVRYGAKELARLQDMIKKTEESSPSPAETNVGFTLVSPPSSAEANEASVEPESMDVGSTKVVNPKTMRDQHGNYPPWYNQKTIKRIKRSRMRRARRGKK